MKPYVGEGHEYVTGAMTESHAMPWKSPVRYEGEEELLPPRRRVAVGRRRARGDHPWSWTRGSSLVLRVMRRPGAGGVAVSPSQLPPSSTSRAFGSQDTQLVSGPTYVLR
jgi:hypothetical protein